MKHLIRHLSSLLVLAIFIAIAAGSLSKATEPCTEKPVDYSAKNVYVNVSSKLSGIEIPFATVRFYIRDHNPAYVEPDQCDFTKGGLITAETERTTDAAGFVYYATNAYEHDNSKDYTEITIEVSAPDYHPYRETKVLYYNQVNVIFTPRLIIKFDQP